MNVERKPIQEFTYTVTFTQEEVNEMMSTYMFDGSSASSVINSLLDELRNL